MKFLSDLQFQKNFLKQHKAYLKKGVYVPHDNLRTYILKGYKLNDWFPNSKHNLKNMIKILIARIFYSVRIRDNGTEFSAQAVYFSTVPQVYNRDAKFFNYEEKKIRTICPNKVRYDLYMHNRGYFVKYFPMVDLLMSDDERFVFEERMIDNRGVADGEWETVFRSIFDIYSAYYKTNGIDKIKTDYHCTNIPNYVPGCISFSTVLYRQHGDLSSDNFMYDADKRLFFIDYDHANYYPIFYDLFFLMVNLYIWKRNDIGISLLTNGAFDAYFSNVTEGETLCVYDAFLVFADYYLGLCKKDGLSEEWQIKFEKILFDIMGRLKR